MKISFSNKSIFIFREEWKNQYPWVTVDPSGNPGLAYCTLCCKSLTAKKYILSMHQQKAKHIKRAGLTPDEVSELVKKTKEKKDVEETDASGKKLYERRYRPAWVRLKIFCKFLKCIIIVHILF